jgi:cold-inducible RNA-binding protein
MKNVFVGNMSFEATEGGLRSIFEPFGEITRVQLITDRDTGRPRGFGFVEMSSDEEAAKAIAALNGTEMNGRALNVNEAKPKTASGGYSRDRDNYRGR